MSVVVKCSYHDDVINWEHFPRYWPFARWIHRSPVNSPHKSQWRGALMLSLICTWINGWVNNREVGDLRRHRAHFDVTVMMILSHQKRLWSKMFFKTNELISAPLDVRYRYTALPHPVAFAVVYVFYWKSSFWADWVIVGITALCYRETESY